MFGLAEIQRMNARAALDTDAETVGSLAEARELIRSLQNALEEMNLEHDESCVSEYVHSEEQAAVSALRDEIGTLTRRMENMLPDMATRYEMADIRAWADCQGEGA